MKAFDRWLQNRRVAQTRPWIPSGARVLDIGCADGMLFQRLRSRIQDGVGIDPDATPIVTQNGYRLITGRFPDDLPDGEPFDAITMLAVLEHIPATQQPRVADRCAALLKPGGRLILTVPSPAVDVILEVMKALRLSEPMSLDEHYHFDVRGVPKIFNSLSLVAARRFELGLNHLFVFEQRRPRC